MKIGGKQRNVSVLMKNMKRHPIGIGRGEFFVNQAFLMKVMSVLNRNTYNNTHLTPFSFSCFSSYAQLAPFSCFFLVRKRKVLKREQYK